MKRIEPASICGDCAAKMGARWPEGHCATIWHGKCSFCGETKACACTTDYQWDDKDSTQAQREV